MSINVGVYGRVSSPRQLEGHSIDTQADRLDKLADSWFGAGMYTLHEYDEGARSGWLPHEQFADEHDHHTRPALTRLLEDADRGLLDFVLFYTVDRFTREMGIGIDAQKRLQRADVPYRFLDMSDVDPTTDEGWMMVGMKMMHSEFWLRQHKRRIKDAWAKRREEGYPPGGRPPWGMKWQDPDTVQRGERRGWVRDPETFHWVVWMKERYLAGWSTTQIGDKLNELQVPRPGGKVGTWESGRVRVTLTNHFYAGLIREPDGTMNPGQHWDERLWEPAEWELMCERLKRNKRLGATTVKSTHYPLLGIIKCQECGYRMYGAVTPAGTRTCVCRTRSHKGKDACRGISYPAEPIEKATLAIVRDLALSDEIQSLAQEAVAGVLGQEQGRLTAHKQELVKELEAVKRRSAVLFDMRADGELTPAQYAEQNQRLTTRREELEGQLAAVERELADQSARAFELDRVRSTLRNFEATWRGLDEAEQKAALELVVEEAALGKDQDGNVSLKVKVAFLPERIIPMPSQTKRKAKSGPESLTLRELAYLKHKQTGLSDQAIANLFDTTVENVAGQWRSIRRRLGTDDLDEAIGLASGRLESESHAIPLTGRANKSPKHRPKIKWTPRLKAIVQALADGKPRKQIMAELVIKEKNLSERIRRMKRAVDVETDEDLLAYARETGGLAT